MGTAIGDPTPIYGARVDVPARLGWLLRTSRLAGGLDAAAMARGLSALGEDLDEVGVLDLEQHGVRDGVLVDAYEQVLGLETGRLRAAVDTLCRSFDYGPPDRRPEVEGELDDAALERALAPVLAGDPTGGEWFLAARALRRSAAVPDGVPLEPLVDRLLREMVRAVGTAWVTRYEAVAQLRCSRHADLVEDAVRALAAEDGSQAVLVDALAAVSEQPTVRLLDWAGSLLSSDRPWLVRGATVAISVMRSGGGLSPSDWQVLVPHFLAGYAAAAASGDPEHGALLTDLFRALPHGVRDQVRRDLPGPLAPTLGAAAWDTTAQTVHLAVCEREAVQLCAETGVEAQPMLGRLLYEAMYEFRTLRVTTSAFLLMASPLVDALLPRLMRLADDGVDPVTRAGAVRALRHCQVPRGTEAVQAWFDARVDRHDTTALLVAGNAGVRLRDDVADRARDDSWDSLRVVEAMGLAGHPGLPAVADDPSRPPAVRSVAAWWVRHGGRVVR